MAKAIDNSIEGFNSEDFAKNLAGQAAELVPSDIKESDRDFVVNIVYEFSLMAGDAIKKDYGYNKMSGRQQIEFDYAIERAKRKLIMGERYGEYDKRDVELSSHKHYSKKHH